MEQKEKQGIYAKYIKRPLDVFCALAFLLLFWWLYLVLATLVRIKLGSPVIFKQPRPGKDEKIFNLYKFRTMTEEKDANGNLLSDDRRLTGFGKILRSTSLDELPEIYNILRGDMSVIGPRPQLVRDMVFMSEKQRRRHTVRPGLSGLAQVRGRNAISWEEKLSTDLEYIENITFQNDVKIIFLTAVKVLKRDGITEDGSATAEDFGDYLLSSLHMTRDEYELRQAEARILLEEEKGKEWMST